jgi:hypothetical protein
MRILVPSLLPATRVIRLSADRDSFRGASITLPLVPP